MINDLDKALRQLLINELPIKNGEVKIEFKPPVRDWSSRIENRPTLNLFLHDIRENKALRQSAWDVKRNGNGGYTKQRTPVRLDLYYLITVWAKEPEDEHRILTRTLAALFRNPTLPEELLTEGLQNQPTPIQVGVAQYDLPHKLTDVWSVLDNEIRPGIDCVITLALNPYDTFAGPLVRTRELYVGQTDELLEKQKLVKETDHGHDHFWMVGGTVGSDEPVEELKLTLVERGLRVPVKTDGRFIIGNLAEGAYTLEVSAKEHEPTFHQINVPSRSYDIQLKGVDRRRDAKKEPKP